MIKRVITSISEFLWKGRSLKYVCMYLFLDVIIEKETMVFSVAENNCNGRSSAHCWWWNETSPAAKPGDVGMHVTDFHCELPHYEKGVSFRVR